MSNEKVGEANAGFERYAEGVKPLLDASALASGIIQQAKEAGTKVRRCATCRNSYTSKSVGEPCSFCATAIKALVAWREADKKALDAWARFVSDAGRMDDWEEWNVLHPKANLARNALRAAADALTEGEKTDG
jgi:hypothetical protein